MCEVARVKWRENEKESNSLAVKWSDYLRWNWFRCSVCIAYMCNVYTHCTSHAYRWKLSLWNPCQFSAIWLNFNIFWSIFYARITMLKYTHSKKIESENRNRFYVAIESNTMKKKTPLKTSNPWNEAGQNEWKKNYQSNNEVVKSAFHGTFAYETG